MHDVGKVVGFVAAAIVIGFGAIAAAVSFVVDNSQIFAAVLALPLAPIQSQAANTNAAVSTAVSTALPVLVRGDLVDLVGHKGSTININPQITAMPGVTQVAAH